MTEAQPDYLAYLLRLWRMEGVDQEAVWRASLEDPQTGQQRGFASLDQVFDYLRKKTGTLPEPPEEGGGE